MQTKDVEKLNNTARLPKYFDRPSKTHVRIQLQILIKFQRFF